MSGIPYRSRLADDGSGSGGGVGVDEVVISPDAPIDPATELWVDSDAVPPTINAIIGGVWTPLGGGAIPGAGTSYPLTFLTGWTGGAGSIYVNGTSATLRFSGVTYNGPGIAVETFSKVSALPAGVPAPFATLRFLTVIHNPVNGGYDNPCPLEVRGDGIWIGSYASRAIATGKAFHGTFTWTV